MSEWRPSASLDLLHARQSLLNCIRSFFADRGVLEVETPVLSQAGNSDPNLQQFSTQDDPSWNLRTSPEYAMKRLLASGSGDIYELGRVFRHGEAGRMHNPEFTLLEWYRVDWGYRQLMLEVFELFEHCANAFDLNWSVLEVTYQESFMSALHLDPISAPLSDLKAIAEHHGLNIHSPGQLERDDWLNILFSELVQARFPDQRITLVHQYPASQAALSRISRENPEVSERFEAFIGAIELANGYGELTDPEEQRDRFESENRNRQRSGSSPVTLDLNLIAALQSGLPSCSGVAVGVDRLLMALTGRTDIRSLLAFSADRA